MGQDGRPAAAPAGPAGGTALLTPRRCAKPDPLHWLHRRRLAELKKPCRFPPLYVAESAIVGEAG